jgi:hypothetical protein
MSEQKVKWLDEYCAVCGRQINSWDKRCDKALCYKKPTCESCIAKEYDLDTEDLRQELQEVFGMRPCMGI